MRVTDLAMRLMALLPTALPPIEWFQPAQPLIRVVDRRLQSIQLVGVALKEPPLSRTL